LGAAKSEVGAARNQFLPTPSVQLLQDNGATTTVLTVQQPLWAGGRLDAGLEAARSREGAAELFVADTKYTLALRVTAAWAAWAQARGRVAALNEGADLLGVYAQSVARRIAGDAAGRVDGELVKSRLTQTQGDLAAARSAERSALTRLSQMVGQPLRTEDMVDIAAVPNAEAPLPAPDALTAQALAHSAALKRIEAEVDALQHDTDVKRAALWPTLALRAQHQQGDSTTTGLTANDSRVILALEYTPGAGLSAGNHIETARARQMAKQESLEAARRELAEKVAADYEEHLSSVERRRQILSTIEASAEVLSSYDRLFVAGKRSWLDVINAAREVIQARTALADIEAQRLAARARLRLHTGEAF
jgi:adhesin transport system outer membrane protein